MKYTIECDDMFSVSVFHTFTEKQQRGGVRKCKKIWNHSILK